MPELPDVTVYVERLRSYLVDQELMAIRLKSAFVLRSVEPKLDKFIGQPVTHIERMGKRIIFCFPKEHYLVLHLMIAGRLRWKKPQATIPGKIGLVAFDFKHGTLMLTEASSKKRASIHAVKDSDNLEQHNRGGLELPATLELFKARLKKKNHTLKRALTDPTILSGIGNAYSDEIYLPLSSHLLNKHKSSLTKNMKTYTFKLLMFSQVLQQA